MGPFGERVPKPIVPICNKPLLVYQLEHFKRLGIQEVLIVIGHLGHRITHALGDGSAYGMRIEYVEQRQRLGLAHAVGQLEKHITRPFVLILGDIFFQVPDLAMMTREFETHRPAAVLAVKDEDNLDAVRKNFAVLLREDGTVRRVIEKPRHVPNRLKGCGLYLFDLHIFDAIRRTPRTAMRDEYELTDSIQILIDYEYTVRVAPVVEWDMNITFIGDLIECCAYQLRKLGKTTLIGEHCQIDGGAQLIDTVLGNNVTIRHPIRLERCVVLDNTTIALQQDLNDCIVTPEATLYAKQAG
jgi:NDP-sugar pyrophosphorylase family protein